MKWFAILSFMVGSQLGAAECLQSIAQLRAAQVKPIWEEVEPSDDVPLVINIQRDRGQVIFTAKKAKDVWLVGELCASANGRTLKLSDVMISDAAPDFLDKMIPAEQTVEIKENEIQLTGLWKAKFKGKGKF